MDRIGKFPYKTYGYRATCNKVFGEAKEEFLGCGSDSIQTSK